MIYEFLLINASISMGYVVENSVLNNYANKLNIIYKDYWNLL